MKAQDLKNSILQLAIQGKLVPQDPNDEPAEVLYAKIQAEKQKLIREGKIKKDKPLPPITDDEIPFPIPATWKWVRLGDMVQIYTGSKDANYGNEQGKYSFFTCAAEPIKCEYYSFEGESLLLPGNGANVGLCIYYDGKFEAYQRTYVLQGFVPYLRYLHYLLSFRWKKYNEDKMYGSAMPYIKLANIQNFLVPLPPLAEQHRIVAKIEELEPLIKQYEQAETELSTLNDTFPEQLKKSILQYAIQGKLVPQDESDEPTEVLYAKIQAEKQKLIKEGKIKKDKPLPPITNDEIPFPIPATWKWVRLGDIVHIINGYAFQSSNYVTISKNQLIRLGNVKNDEMILEDKVVYISEEDAIKAKDFKILNDDILVTLTGTRYKKDYFYTAVYQRNDRDNTLYLNQRVGLFRIYNKLIEAKMLSIMLKNKYLLDEIFSTETGTVNQGNIGTGNVAKLLVPLPPLAEQHRIVTKVNELMQYCEKLNL